MAQKTSLAADAGVRTVLSTPVYEALKDRFMDQTFVAGQRLNIDGLANSLSVSPTPVREALARLAAERLVELVPYKGYLVSPLLTPRELADLMHVRKLLETDAAYRAATRIGLVDLREMDRILQDIERIETRSGFSDYLAFNQLDQRFHELLVGAAENSVLLDTYRSLHVHIQLARFFRERPQAEVQASNAEHRAIFHAVSDHDPDKAVKAVRTHLDQSYLRTVEPQTAATQ
jgi:DNA-binding GntR family transcriptional regulator